MASTAARIRSGGRNGKAADRVASTAERACRPSCRSHPQRGPPHRSLVAHHRASTLPLRVSKVLPPLFFAAVASGSGADPPNTSLRLGPAAPPRGPCAATLQTVVCIFSVFLWPPSSCLPTSGGMPHLLALVWMYLISLTSASEKFFISLQ